MTVHFQRIPRGGAYPLLSDLKAWQRGVFEGMAKARYYLNGQKYVAVWMPSEAGPEADLLPTAEQVGVMVQYKMVGPAPGPSKVWTPWHVIEPVPVTRYAFVVRWPDGREPELATRDGRLIVSTDKTVLCPPYEAVVFSGDPAWTVPVADEPAPAREEVADAAPAS